MHLPTALRWHPGKQLKEQAWHRSTEEIVIARPADAVWDALADIGALHTRLVPGFVTDCRLEPGARVVTFANGLVARELIVAVDSALRRIAWANVGGRMTHHNASAQALQPTATMPAASSGSPTSCPTRSAPASTR